ncbi:MAG: chemotaxis protein CheX [Desulfobacterales bacterium]|nr:chemotaxis protein CheX [Desulfobacterales bacterium]
MDVNIINPFINATVEVMKNLASVEAVPGKPFLKKDDLAMGDVSSIVGMTGIKNASFSLSFDEACILKIVSNMFHEEMTELNDDVADAAGEIANMISGHARRTMDDMGINLKGAIPTVATKKNHTITHCTDGPKIATTFTVNPGTFTLEICLDS